MFCRCCLCCRGSRRFRIGGWVYRGLAFDVGEGEGVRGGGCGVDVADGRAHGQDEEVVEEGEEGYSDPAPMLVLLLQLQL